MPADIFCQRREKKLLIICRGYKTGASRSDFALYFVIYTRSLHLDNFLISAVAFSLLDVLTRGRNGEVGRGGGVERERARGSIEREREWKEGERGRERSSSFSQEIFFALNYWCFDVDTVSHGADAIKIKANVLRSVSVCQQTLAAHRVSGPARFYHNELARSIRSSSKSRGEALAPFSFSLSLFFLFLLTPALPVFFPLLLPFSPLHPATSPPSKFWVSRSERVGKGGGRGGGKLKGGLWTAGEEAGPKFKTFKRQHSTPRKLLKELENARQSVKLRISVIFISCKWEHLSNFSPTVFLQVIFKVHKSTGQLHKNYSKIILICGVIHKTWIKHEISLPRSFT